MRSGSLFAQYRGQWLFAWIALILALGTALAAAAMTWAWREGSAQWTQFIAYRDLQRNADRADSLTVVYDKLGHDLEALGAALPSQNEASHVVNLLVDEARKRGLGLSGIMALDEIPFPGYSELPFEVNLNGEFLHLLRYFHDLETHGMAIQLRRAHIHNEVMNKARIQAKVELSILIPTGGGIR